MLERSEQEPYFLGSLVLVRQSESDFDVIDGQQRLTTLSIRLSVLRDLEADGQRRNELANLVLDPGSVIDEIPSRPRLALRAQDAPFFRKFVQEPGRIAELTALTDAALGGESQQAIRGNARALLARLESRPVERRRRLATFLSKNTFLVVVQTPGLESAYRIFSVMNARGLDLTPTDIFKSQILGSLKDEKDYQKRWEDAEEALGSDNFTDLFRDIRTVVSGERAKRELLQEFEGQVLGDYVKSGTLEAFLEDQLFPYADALARTVEIEFGGGAEWRPVQAWLKRLAAIDNKDWRPAALWALVNHRDEPAFLAQFLRSLERLAAYQLLRESYATPRIGRYLELVRQLKGGAGLAAPALQLSDDERAAALRALDGDIYRLQARRARYVLLRADSIEANDPGASYEHSIISIEHVLPQNPAENSEWLRSFPDPEEREELTHKIGNLVLLNRRKNAEASRREFDAKKRSYFTGSNGSAVFALTTQVLSENVWTPETVRRRQAYLVGRLADEWELR